jgi:hypothetical protein
MGVAFQDFEHHLYHLYHIDGKTVEQISETFNMKTKEVIENLVYYHIIDDKSHARRAQKITKFYFLINHTKKSIVRTNNNAPEHISDALFTSIRNNKWSLTDVIQLVEYNKDIELVRSKIKEEYTCNQPEWFD